MKLTNEELICLLFWYSVFKSNINVNTKEHNIDRKLFERLKNLSDLYKGIPLKECGITGTPRHQPEE